MRMQSILRAKHKLIIIIGPPFSGKRRLFMNEYQSKQFILLDISSHTTLLPKSCLIANDFNQVDDLLNHYQLMNENANVDIEYIFVKPKYGIIQCLWSSEFAFAEQMNNDLYKEKIKQQLEKYYNYMKLVDIDRRNVKSITHECDMYVNRDKVVFSHQGLIVDAHAIFEYNTTTRKLEINNYKSISYLFSQWNSIPRNTHARIILFYHNEHFRQKLKIPETLETSRLKDMFIDAITDLDLSFPIYYMLNNNITDSDTSLFFQQPNPGMFAFTQYIHSLNFKQSVYLQSIVEGLPNYSDLIPIRYASFDSVLQVFNTNGQLTESQQDENRVNSAITNELNKILSEPNAMISEMINSLEYNSNMKSLRIDQVKRFPLLQQLNYDDNITDECYFESRGKSCDGRTHGIILQRKYIECFEEQEDAFEQDYETNGIDQIMIPTTDTESQSIDFSKTPKKMEKTNFISPLAKLKPVLLKAPGTAIQTTADKTSPSTPTSDNTETISTSPTTSTPPTTATSTPPSSSSGEHKITMTIEQVCQHFGITYFQRGRDYKNSHRISKMRTKTVNSVAFKLYSLCQGSREEPYKQESLFKSGKLLKSICTCPMGEDQGNCKHICAQLLAYMDKENYEEMASGKKKKSDPTQSIPPQLFSTLNPMSDNWCIKGKVMKKTNIKKFVNQNNSGKVAGILLKDELVLTPTKDSINQIKIVLFTEAVEAYYDLLEEGNVYLISGGNLQARNPNYKSTEMTPSGVGQISDFEIQLNPTFSIVKNVHQLGVGPLGNSDMESEQNKEKPKEQFEKEFESRVSKENDGALEFVPFIVEEEPQRQKKPSSDSKKRKVAEAYEDDDDDPLKLLDELHAFDLDHVEKSLTATSNNDDQPSKKPKKKKMSPKTSPKKRQKISNKSTDDSSNKIRRRSEPVRKLTFAGDDDYEDEMDNVFKPSSNKKKEKQIQQQQQQQQTKKETTTPKKTVTMQSEPEHIVIDLESDSDEEMPDAPHPSSKRSTTSISTPMTKSISPTPPTTAATPTTTINTTNTTNTTPIDPPTIVEEVTTKGPKRISLSALVNSMKANKTQS
jgi:hypothetical protein